MSDQPGVPIEVSRADGRLRFVMALTCVLATHGSRLSAAENPTTAPTGKIGYVNVAKIFDG